MTLKTVRICAIFFLCACALSVSRSRAEEGAHLKALPYFHEILSHADDLNLSAEQKTKLNEIGDGPVPKSRSEFGKFREKVSMILTKDQNEKVEGYFKRMKEEREREREHERAHGNSEDNDDHK